MSSATMTAVTMDLKKDLTTVDPWADATAAVWAAWTAELSAALMAFQRVG